MNSPQFAMSSPPPHVFRHGLTWKRYLDVFDLFWRVAAGGSSEGRPRGAPLRVGWNAGKRAHGHAPLHRMGRRSVRRGVIHHALIGTVMRAQ